MIRLELKRRDLSRERWGQEFGNNLLVKIVRNRIVIRGEVHV